MGWTPMIENILSAYQNHLVQKHGNQTLKRFNHLLENNQEAGVSEALVFNWLCGIGQNPELNENNSTGGADFICHPWESYRYIVEVTCLGKPALTKETGCHMISGQLMAISSPTKMLRQRVTDKAGQLAGNDIPTVLAITSLHDGAYILLSPNEAVSFLISDWAFAIPMSNSNEDTYLSTDLKHSIFFKRDLNDPSKVAPCRQSISAVLLIPVSGDRLNVTGILHPEPIHPFSIHALKKVPFVRVQNWPIAEGIIFTEWVISDPYASVFHHFTHIK
ncbi:MAG: hypothetical protein U0Z53_03615 [Blastocatellia bacterium]